MNHSNLRINKQPTTMAELEARRMDGQPGQATAWKSPNRRFLADKPKSTNQLYAEERQARQDKAITYCAQRLAEARRFPLADLAAHLVMPSRSLGKMLVYAGIVTDHEDKYQSETQKSVRTTYVIGLRARP